MVIKSKGIRSKTRKKFAKKKTLRGRIAITRFLQTFENGEKVIIHPEISFPRNIPHKRFYGKIGEVIGKRGKAFLVEVVDGNKRKVIICPPIHLKKLKAV
jgi:large subunit ribosomal protein L21e